MKSPRSIFSATTALGLVALLANSVLLTGVTSPLTQVAFGLLAVFGVFEILLLSYMPRRFVSLPATMRPAPGRAAVRSVVRVPAVVEYPACRAKAA